MKSDECQVTQHFLEEGECDGSKEEKYESKWSDMKLLEKLKHIKSYITVEPLLACYVMPSVLAALAVQNMNLEKACRVNKGYGEEICDKLINQEAENHTLEMIEVQSLVANMSSWKSPLQTSIPAFLVIFIGAWSDRTGRRRPCMMLPLFGELITSVGLIFCTIYFLQWPMEVAGVVEALPPALTGSWTTMFMSVFSYISDNTSIEDRTYRTGIVNVFVSLGVPIGTALSGILTKVLGFYGIFTISIGFYLMGFLYAIFGIEDKVIVTDEKEGNKNFLMDFFNPKHVKDTLMVAFKTRDGSRRLRVMLLMLVFVTLTGPTYGETAVVYLFTRYKFNFTEVDYSIFMAYSVVINLLGIILAVSFFSRYLKMDDSLIGVISGLSKISASFIYAFAPTVTWFYLAPVFDILSGTGIIVMRSIASKLVESNETGKIHSLFGVCEAIVPMIYTPMYSQVYINTINSMPGAFFLVGAMLMVPSVITFMGMYLLERRDKQIEAKKTQQANDAL